MEPGRGFSDDFGMSRFTSRVGALAANTPGDRNRVVDLMRVVSILVVIYGHWLMAAVTMDGDQLQTGHLLSMAHWTHPLTWLLQVMPVFFFVGGYSNALSWRSARRRGTGYGGWLRARLRRLVLPVVPLLVVWGVGGWLAIRAGLEWETLQMASQVALVPTWFLAAYVVIVALAPLALRIWDHMGWWSIVLGIGLAAAADWLSAGLGYENLGFLNYVLVWGVVHMLGYAWVDGRFAASARRALLGAVGLSGLVALVVAGPYATAMVGSGTDGITNSFPPRVTLIFLGMFQAGLVLIAEPLLDRIAHRPKIWAGVVAVSAQIMTLYLWHLTAMVLMIGASIAMGGFGLHTQPDTVAWWLNRPVWFAVLTLTTVLVAMLLGRFERPGPDTRPEPRAWRPLATVTLTCVGLGMLAYKGIADLDGLNGLSLLAPVLGVIVGGVSGARLAGRGTVRRTDRSPLGR